MSRLLIRPKPVEGECFGGFVVRIARANGYRNVRTFCQEFCSVSHYQSYYVPESKIATLIEIKHQDSDNLWLKHRLSTGFTYKGVAMPSEFVAVGKQFCAQCLAEGGYRIAQWNLGWIPICLEHQTLLSVGCTVCTSRLDRFDDARCNCILHALEDLVQVDDQVIAFIRRLEAGVISQKDGATWRKRLRKWIADAYLQSRPKFGRYYPNAVRLPKLARYPLSPSQTVDYYSRLLETGQAA